MARGGTTSRETRQALGVEERAALVRRAGNERDELAIAAEGGIEPLAGSAAVGVGQQRGAFQNVGLLQIVLRHGDAPGGGASMQRGHLRSVAAQRERERLGHGLAGQIVFGGSQAAHQDENVDAAQRGANGADEILLPVAHDGLEGDGDADAVELFREVERVGVLAEGGEHLGADGDDFGFHKGSFQLLAAQVSAH